MSMTACCGLDCGECPALVARRTGDDDLRRRTAAEWSALYGAEIAPETVDCDGCLREGGVHFPHCDVCGVRGCCTGKGLSSCAGCDSYPCPLLEEIFGFAPEAKARLDSLRGE